MQLIHPRSKNSLKNKVNQFSLVSLVVVPPRLGRGGAEYASVPRSQPASSSSALQHVTSRSRSGVLLVGGLDKIH